DGACGEKWLRQGDGHVSLERLGHFPPALLGYADSDHLLRQGRHCSGARERPARAFARQRADHLEWWVALDECPRVPQCAMSEVRRSGAPRDRYHGYICRFVLVLLPLY